jgi:hypothetical protein
VAVRAVARLCVVDGARKVRGDEQVAWEGGEAGGEEGGGTAPGGGGEGAEEGGAVGGDVAGVGEFEKVGVELVAESLARCWAGDLALFFDFGGQFAFLFFLEGGGVGGVGESSEFVLYGGDLGGFVSASLGCSGRGLPS